MKPEGMSHEEYLQTEEGVVHIAIGWLAEVAGEEKKWPAVGKKLDQMSRKRGLQTRTREVLRYARDGIKAGNWAYAYDMLDKYMEELL